MIEPTTPMRVGRYAIFDKIAAGGMASVHVGRLLGEAGFSRTVAIKRLHAHFVSDPEFVAMFTDEARLAARIRHPNVVATLDVVASGEELFLVMDYIEGESLWRLLRMAMASGQPISPALVVAVMSGALQGLDAAHAAKSESGTPLGIVHRDVSPQNIMVGADGVARVLDFGVAKAATRVHSTRDGALKGKLSYMAPEQVSGLPVTRQTDVFAAAAVTWELLTASRLFVGDTEGETVNNLLQKRIEPPSTRAPGLPAALDDVVLRGLARAPAERWATAGEMAIALEEALTPASRHVVAAWVREAAEETLGSRAKLVAEIENRSSIQLRAAEPVEPKPVSTTPAKARPAAPPDTDEVPTRSSVSVVSVHEQAPPPSRRGRALAIAAGTTAIAALVFAATRSRGKEESAARAPATGASSITVASSAPPSSASAAPVQPTATASTAAAPPSTSSATSPVVTARLAPSSRPPSGSTPTAATATSRPPKPVVTASPSSSSNPSNPNYTRD